MNLVTMYTNFVMRDLFDFFIIDNPLMGVLAVIFCITTVVWSMWYLINGVKNERI